MVRRFLALSLFTLLLSACAVTPREGMVAQSQPGLVEALSGRLDAAGAFTSQIAGVNRPFTVAFSGRKAGDEFLVREDIRFADGQTQLVTWRFTPAGEGRWRGTREDVIGEADVRETPEGIRLKYVADTRGPDGEVTRLGFDDLIYLREDGVLINEARVSKFGLPVGRVYLEIRR